jgi:hypothetical protein
MNDDQLRDRIARLDPLGRSDLGGASIEPITSPAARSLLEDIMNTPLTLAEPDTQQPARGQRPWWATVGVAAAVVAAVAVGVAVFNGGDDDTREIAGTTTVVGAPATTAAPGKVTVLDLSTGVEDLLASCAVLDPTIVGQAPVAFKGTVTLAEGGVVQLMVDQSYRGVDAQAVTLSAPEGQEALIGGVAWVVGEQYLVTAYDGVVSYCGQTGPATPELQAIFDQAFAAG